MLSRICFGMVSCFSSWRTELMVVSALRCCDGIGQGQMFERIVSPRGMKGKTRVKSHSGRRARTSGVALRETTGLVGLIVLDGSGRTGRTDRTDRTDRTGGDACSSQPTPALSNRLKRKRSNTTARTDANTYISSIAIRNHYSPHPSPTSHSSYLSTATCTNSSFFTSTLKKKFQLQMYFKL